jgi:hypothetical protein
MDREHVTVFRADKKRSLLVLVGRILHDVRVKFVERIHEWRNGELWGSSYFEDATYLALKWIINVYLVTKKKTHNKIV